MSDDCFKQSQTETSCVVPPISESIICFSGVIPNSDLLAGSEVEVDSRKAVIVDKVTQPVEGIAELMLI